MATSYTSLLGLALPVTGELAGTWGDTVNNSITSLLDTAVAGTTTLSTDADVTLTTTTGASNQARQAILLCSGARTALRTITAPAQSKIYVVINSTTGGFGVKLVGAGPTTGVTVAAGKTAVLVWNGSDFVEVAPATATTATNLAGGAAGSVPYQTGSGATTFLSLGTAGQVLQVNAGATAPEWVSSTGTGNVVRATSPTIATPTFTTSATFPLHIGGTGTTSTLTLRSTSGVGTTGADIIFQTGNNGATEAMRILNSGNVGVGTATPSELVDIVKAQDGVTRAIIRNTSAGTAAQAQYQLSNGTSLASFGHTGASFTTAGVFRQDGSYISAAGAGGLTLNTSVSQPIYFGTASTERMRIDSSGNVGIGTASPSQPLTIGSSTANFLLANGASTGASYIRVTNTSGDFVAGLNNSSATAISGGIAYASFVGSNNSTALHLLTNGTVRATVDTSGNVGIGTASPGVKLDVVGSVKAQNTATKYALLDASTTRPAVTLYADTDVNASSILNFYNVSTGGTIASGRTQEIRFWYTDTAGTTSIAAGINSFMTATGAANATSAALDFQTKATTDAGAVTRMRIDSTGRLLVTGGTTTGMTKQLNVYTAAEATVLLAADSTGEMGVSFRDQTAGTNWGGIQAFNNSGSNRYIVFNNGGEKMRLDVNGKLLLGTTTRGLGGNADMTVANGTNTVYSSVTGSTVQAYVGVDASTGFIGNYTNHPLLFLTNNTERMRIDSAGNVGIGVTPSAWGSVFKALDLNTAAGVGGTSGGAYLAYNAFYNAAGNWIYKTTTTAGLYSNELGKHIWSTAASGTAGNTISFTQAMTLDTSGNLGIGTTTPVNKLQINGSLGRNAPVTKTGNFTLADTENWLICNGAGTITVTLPAASSWTGREVMIKTIAAQTVVSASSNVVPLAGGAAGTAILAATAGKFATLVSDGTNWIIMQAN